MDELTHDGGGRYYPLSFYTNEFMDNFEKMREEFDRWIVVAWLESPYDYAMDGINREDEKRFLEEGIREGNYHLANAHGPLIYVTEAVEDYVTETMRARGE